MMSCDLEGLGRQILNLDQEDFSLIRSFFPLPSLALGIHAWGEECAKDGNTLREPAVFLRLEAFREINFPGRSVNVASRLWKEPLCHPAFPERELSCSPDNLEQHGWREVGTLRGLRMFLQPR